MLMKVGMKEGGTFTLSPYQVASLRMIFSGLALLPFCYSALKQIPKNKLFVVVLSGVMGSFIPAYLFCIAETKIDSARAGNYPVYLAEWERFVTIADRQEMSIQLLEQTQAGFITFFGEKRVASTIRDVFAGVRLVGPA